MRTTEQQRIARRVGASLRSAREASTLSHDHVARSAGLTGRELARYEQGREIPCRRDLQALAGACGIDPDELLPDELMALLPQPEPDTASPNF